MASRYGLYLAAIGGLATIGAVAADLLTWRYVSPGAPPATTQQHWRRPERSQIERETGCDPVRLATLPVGKRSSETQRCAQQREDRGIAEDSVAQAALSTEAADRGLVIAYRQARSLAVQAVATVAALIAAIAAAVAAGFAVHFARRDFIATHRPRVRVRFFQDDGGGVDGGRKAWITIANVGNSTAAIVAIGGALGVRTRDTKNWRPPGIQASAEGHGPPPDNVLRGGEARTYWVSSGGPVSAGDLADVGNGVADLLALGEIRYTDDNGTLRHTGFMWRWNPKDREFYPVDEPGRNYED